MLGQNNFIYWIIFGIIKISQCNIYVIEGSNVTLYYETNSTRGPMWRKMDVGHLRNESQFISKELEVDKVHLPKYSIDNTFNGHWNLIITNIFMLDAAKYICIDDLSYGITIDVIVVEQRLHCTHNALLNINEVNCTLRYRGNIPPKAQWFFSIGTLIISSKYVMVEEKKSELTSIATFPAINKFDINCEVIILNNEDFLKLTWSSDSNKILSSQNKIIVLSVIIFLLLVALIIIFIYWKQSIIIYVRRIIQRFNNNDIQQELLIM